MRLILLSACFPLLMLTTGRALATVLINEIFWMGSDLSTADEWIEIAYVPDASGAAVIDLSGFELRSGLAVEGQKLVVRFATGASIASGQYLVIANYSADASRLERQADVVTTAMGLPNSKLFLGLYDASGSLIDSADDFIGAPMAGINATGTGQRASMMRIHPPASGSLALSWRSSSTFIGLDDGTPAFATPGHSNAAGFSFDTFAPREVTDFFGSLSGSVLSINWRRSASVDVRFQHLSIVPFGSTSGGIVSLPPSSVSFQSGSMLFGSGVDVRISLEDFRGNVSSGVGLRIAPNRHDILETKSQTGTETSSFVSPIRISEVLLDPIGADDEEWIEIMNVSTGSLSLSGMVITDASRRFRIGAACIGSGSISCAEAQMLGSQAVRLFAKTETDIALENAGETVRIFSGDTLLDELVVPKTAEGVSFGRMGTQSGEILKPFCTPSPGVKNDVEPLDMRISVQNDGDFSQGSGSVTATGKLSINLIAQAASGSMAGAVCSWDYGDGFTSDSCNPPSHTFSVPGQYELRLNAKSYCDDTVEQTLAIFVYEKKKGTSENTKNSVSISEQNTCTILSRYGMRITEVMPDPFGNEAEQEFIELRNVIDQGVSLCGWKIDDADGGSKAFALDGEKVAPGEFLLLPRSQTALALNNDSDEVRLFSPGPEGSSGLLLDRVSYEKAIPGESYALRSDGLFVWTPFFSPGDDNLFRSSERRFSDAAVIVSAALPNPHGKDADGEWIEILNLSLISMELIGWSLASDAATAKRFSLDGVTIEPMQTLRFTAAKTGIELKNSRGAALLRDPDGYVISALGWTEAVDGRIYRPAVETSARARVRVERVVDGDTFDVALADPDQLKDIPDSLKRRWLAVSDSASPRIRVRLIGIDTPETVHPRLAVQAYGAEASAFLRNLLEGKVIELGFDAELWDKYDRLLAYAYLPSGELAQSELLRSGLAFAYLRYPFRMSDLFAAEEREARAALLGMWTDPQMPLYAQEVRSAQEIEELLETEGLTLTVEPPSGIVASGTVLDISTNVLSDIFFSTGSGTPVLLSGSMIITSDALLTFHAERATASGTLRSSTVERRYALLKRQYDELIAISEAYPSPTQGEDEWIELFNASAESVGLAGWMIDDEADGGSKPWRFPPDAYIPASGFLLVMREQSDIALNNDGDEIRLIAPDGTMKSSVRFSSVKRGKSAAFSGGDSCVSDVATPSRGNVCIALAKGKNAPDADHDFLSDDYEHYLYSTDPKNPDTDNDGFLDGFETDSLMNPLERDEKNRMRIARYRDFLLEHINPKIRVLKRDGIRIEGKSVPGFSVVALVDGRAVTASGSAATGKWSMAFRPPFSSLSLDVDLSVTDPAGRNIDFPSLFRAEISPVTPAKRTVRIKTKRGEFRYRNIVSGEESMPNSSHSMDETIMRLLRDDLSANHDDGPLVAGIVVTTVVSIALAAAGLAAKY